MSMLTARESAVRLLQLTMVASLILPAALFAYASLSDYRDAHAVANERINRSLDVLQEQALKVFQTVDRTYAEVDEIVRGMSDDEILAAQSSLQPRLDRIVAVMPQVQAIVLIGRDGRLLASSAPQIAPPNANFSDRDYFKAQVERDAGTYVSDVHVGTMGSPQRPGAGVEHFDLSHRLVSPDGTFIGIIAVSVRPQYFEDFYSLIEQSPGSFYALMRSDGTFLARYPERKDGVLQISPSSGLRTAIEQGHTRGLYVTSSAIDGANRHVGFRKLENYPVYALAGIDSAAIRAEWLSDMRAHLLFGLPVTLLLFGVLWVALRRTRRLHDEAERRETAERALRQSQRLEAIGQLTGGVAHDFNNLLMIVSGTVQRLRRHISDEKQTQLLDTITNATQRGESLTRQLLAFSRRTMLQPSVIDLAERLPEIKDMLSRTLRGDIDIRVMLPRRTCFVKVDASELELALLNLAVNARDAMPTGGTLTLSVEPTVLNGQASEEGLSGDFVAIKIADTGTGIPPEILPRVFEPFFTTKEVGKGTGLGLSQVYGFAKQSGGVATISSVQRKGTVITLFLPRTWEIPPQPHQDSPAIAVMSAAGTALLVEDNVDVAEIGKSFLEQLGYKVKQTASAEAALDLIEREGAIDVMLSDILMPGSMNGLQLAEIVQRRFPEIAVLLTTGFSRSAQNAARRGFRVLHKPYDLAALQRAIREAQRTLERPGEQRTANLQAPAAAQHVAE